MSAGRPRPQIAASRLFERVRAMADRALVQLIASADDGP
jgi:hypothetical protein